ncbi:HAD family hydrolase [Brucepastera parasyntrophica]|uniref:HAD family hydrolase n=1 Tax=Brucepastera parasyntrophica TaxID=2880008 RepID=UPI00210B4460|nr:HAD family hydrolase [Brucepastera parasyntrophica]ULQ60693.1 HAD family hydrolase [Brucepastera parasyntrophica]
MTIYRIPDHLSCIIFDIDSTLYTNEAYAREQTGIQIRRFADIKGISYSEAEKMIAAFRENFRKEHGTSLSLGNTLTHFGIPIEESIRWRNELLEPAEFLAPDVCLRETLSELSAKYTLGAVTNNPLVPAKKTLAALGVADLFPVIIALDTTGYSKPHPEPLRRAAKAAGVPLSKCLSVGDRFDIDIALPLELGMGGILVSGVEDVYKLPDMLS